MQCKRRTVLGMLSAIFGAITFGLVSKKSTATDQDGIHIQFVRGDIAKIQGHTATVRKIYELWKQEIQSNGQMHKYADGHQIDELVLN